VTSLARFAIRVLVTLLVLGAFLVGFTQFPGAAAAPRLGVIFGLGSAVYWGFTAAQDDQDGFPWNGFFNACAAMCAAVAVGYLVPKEACEPPPGSFIPRVVCRLHPQAVPAELAPAAAP
jgi:drug/metabolite transporter (DMT)-like permease